MPDTRRRSPRELLVVAVLAATVPCLIGCDTVAEVSGPRIGTRVENAPPPDAELRIPVGVGRVESIAMSPDGHHLATSDGSGPMLLWDGASGQVVETFSAFFHNAEAVPFSPDGQRLAMIARGGSLCIWHLRSRRMTDLLPAREFIMSFAFSPDWKWLATTDHTGLVHLRSAETGEIQRTFRVANEAIYSLAIRPEANTLLASTASATVHVVDLATGAVVRTHRRSPDTTSTTMSVDGRFLATTLADGTARLLEARSGKEVWAFPGHGDIITTLAADAAATLIVTGGRDANVRVWSLASKKEVRRMALGGAGVRAAVLSADGTRLVVSSFNDDVRQWNLVTGEELPAIAERRTGSIWAVALTADGQRLATGAEDGVVRLWDVTTGRPIRRIPTAGGTRFVGFAVRDTVLVTASGRTGAESPPYPAPPEFESWDVQLLDVESGRTLGVLAQEPQLAVISMSPDGRLLALGRPSGAISLWDLPAKKEIGSLDHVYGSLAAIAFSPDGAWLATGGANVWTVSDTAGRSVASESTRGAVWSLALGADGGLVAAADDRGTIRIESTSPLGARAAPAVLRGRGHVSIVAFAGEGRQLIVIRDQLLGVLDLAAGEETAFRTDLPVACAALSRDGSKLAVGLAGGITRVWAVDRLLAAGAARPSAGGNRS
jgi:WD40 repeat protein